MKELIKDYLENNNLYQYHDVDVISYIIKGGGHVVHTTIKHSGSMYKETVRIELWDAIAFINNKINNTK